MPRQFDVHHLAPRGVVLRPKGLSKDEACALVEGSVDGYMRIHARTTRGEAVQLTDGQVQDSWEGVDEPEATAIRRRFWPDFIVSIGVER